MILLALMKVDMSRVNGVIIWHNGDHIELNESVLIARWLFGSVVNRTDLDCPNRINLERMCMPIEILV